MLNNNASYWNKITCFLEEKRVVQLVVKWSNVLAHFWSDLWTPARLDYVDYGLWSLCC